LCGIIPLFHKPFLVAHDSKMKRRSDDSKKSRTAWSDEADDALLKAVLEDQQDRQAEGASEEEEDWDEIAKAVPGKTPVQCLKRYMILNTKQESREATAPDSESSAVDTNPVAQPPPDAASAPTSTSSTAAAAGAAAAAPAARYDPSEPSHSIKQDGDEDDDEEGDDFDDDEDDELGGKDSKRSRTEGDTSAIWPEDEVELLKRLVEQYSDGK
jgi:hypothetical protein